MPKESGARYAQERKKERFAARRIWIYAMKLEKTPKRRHAVSGRKHFAFSDVRRDITEAVMSKDFSAICSHQHKSLINSIAAALLRIAA